MAHAVKHNKVNHNDSTKTEQDNVYAFVSCLLHLFKVACNDDFFEENLWRDAFIL